MLANHCEDLKIEQIRRLFVLHQSEAKPEESQYSRRYFLITVGGYTRLVFPRLEGTILMLCSQSRHFFPPLVSGYTPLVFPRLEGRHAGIFPALR